MAKTLLPGFGGRVPVVIPVTDAEETFSEAYDCAKCAQLAIQITEADTEGDALLTVQESFDGGLNWATRTAAAAPVAGAITRYDVTDGPFGLIRFKLTVDVSSDYSVSDSSASSPSDEAASVGSSEFTITLVGFPIQTSW